MATLSGIFGVLAIVLTAAGLYGVISYMVARRTSEIGIRVTLGADRGAVIALILREAAVALAAGVGAGTLLALAAGRVAAVASYLPARRAASVNPASAPRHIA